MADEFLTMTNISKIYDNGIVANRDVNFSLQKGEIHALVGENGAGKSTLMHILFGMEKPSAGKIYKNKEELILNSSKDAIRNEIGMVHQHFMLIENFTVLENILLGIEIKKHMVVDKKNMLIYVQQLCEKYNLTLNLDQKVSELSVGEKQKIEILKALARGANILILDEPTAVLTPQETDVLFDQLLKLKQNGHTIVFISHKLREVKSIADRITVLRNGQLIGVFSSDELTEEELSLKIVGFKTKALKKPLTTNTSKIVVQVKDVNYMQKNKTILKNINFHIRSGSILGIAGVQGNGQVPLIELMTGQRKLQKGKIEMNGVDVSHFSVKQLRSCGLAYIPEDRIKQGVAKKASIVENLISINYEKTPFSKHGVLQHANIVQFSTDAIKNYQIKCKNSDTTIEMLSGGNMQKVVVARECASNPSFLIAEGPTRGVDVGAAQIIYEKINELKKAGTAILLISSDLSELIELSDSIMVFYEGEITAFFENTRSISEKELGLYLLGVKKQNLHA